MNNSNAHLNGNVNLDMRVTKMPDGRFKASSQGIESFHNDQAEAVRSLQTKLQSQILSGDYKPGM